MKKPVLAGHSPEKTGYILKSVFGDKFPDFRARQICKWIIQGASSFSEMNNIPLSLRDDLANAFNLFSSKPGLKITDKDGTVKIQIILEDNNKIEAVILHDGKGRKTACLSTQAGCAGACVFCKTGSLGFKRNLEAGEIIEEFLFMKSFDSDISHIVIMGMGEPLLNLDELRKAITFFTEKDSIGISKRRITLSTAGIADGIRDLADNGPDIRLAFSLTSAREELRRKLMPIALSNPLPLIKESLLHYQKKQKSRITLEAVLLSGINTSEEEARAMAEFAGGLDCVINLIPWNSVENLEFENRLLVPPSPKETALFATSLKNKKLNVTMRMGKGKNVSGACGQLG